MAEPTCGDCAERHETGAEALRCDHERGIERLSLLVGGLHAMGTVRGCPLCEHRDLVELAGGNDG